MRRLAGRWLATGLSPATGVRPVLLPVLIGASLVAGLAGPAVAASATTAGHHPATPGHAIAAAPAVGALGGSLYHQSFANSVVAPGTWVSGGGARGGAPCLTARYAAEPTSIPACGPAGDAAGAGVLRLTSNGRQQSGFVLFTKPLDASAGLKISFDMYQYDTTSRHGGADGIGFVLIDGRRSPAVAGAAGGWLGYRGLTGGLLGIGFDEWGNFSNRALWGSGPNQLVPDSIVVRGAGAAGYPYLAGVRTPQLARDHTASRTAARRHVVIKISTSGLITVSVDFGRGLTREISNLDLNDVPGQPALPSTVKFGFTAATGDNTAIHEISDLVISHLPPELRTAIRPAGRFRAGGTGLLTATVSADPSGGPTAGKVTALIKVPGALVPTQAGGNGWTCALGGQQVSCTRGDVLPPGGSYPPVNVTTSVAADAPRTLPVSSSADTPNLALSPGNTSHATVPIAPPPPGPDLSVRITPLPTLVAGRTGTLRLDVANAPKAGPTRGPVTLRYDAPPGSTIEAASGKGWTCARQPKQVTCSRPQVLQPGQGFPPVYVVMSICHQAACTLHGATAKASTPGSPQATATANLPVAQHSSLGLSLSSNPAAPRPGYDTTFTAVITNGGPTDVANTRLVVRVPRGFGGQWRCDATQDSRCPAKLPAGPLTLNVYVATGGTVTLTATGPAPRTVPARTVPARATAARTAAVRNAAARAAAAAPVTATLSPPGTYTDPYCSQPVPCTATGDATAGAAAK